ncbi:16S rRNA (cytosine(967)-C(5))-methyltransferase RsmB [Methyloversatilis thermotolerans]|uniref:16S rRNA (cytosine(967)-C(5))-methyltransferase RsmB n=1 Tax=Methyloversatilis thermotolerans TaxID=1346290 RepID=UPI000361C523|nr:16S rRNA (cytosine(967)-C(5))-methyltransferase RsmB [Methyloversatilis thermotolerans]
MPPAESLAASMLDAARAVAAVIAGSTLDEALSRGAAHAVNTAAVRDMAYQCLRAHTAIQTRLGVLVPRALREADRQALLLVALCRMEARPDSAHTTVSQAVDAARTLGGDRFASMMNAVLRTAQRRTQALDDAVAASPAAQWQHPQWWLERLQQDHPRHWQDIARAGNAHPPMALRINRRRTDLARAQARLVDAGLSAQVRGDCGLLLDKPVPVQRLPGFAEGELSVQDIGAQHAAGLLDAGNGQRVLDASAAPGGKACHLLEVADIDLLALDHNPVRARRIDENFSRLGLPGRVAIGDAAQPDDWWDGRPFDRILADVPCSASGVLRRHPDAKWLRRPGDIAHFVAQQRAILDALWRLLAAGGKLLYATCSVFRAENQDQVAAFLTRHPDCEQLSPCGAPDLQLLPTAEHDGFYYALLQKRPRQG